MTVDIVFSKQTHSELVIRKSLYWLSSSTSWELNETKDEWTVTLPVSDHVDQNYRELHRLVNDHILREKISYQTQDVRKRIISKALRDIEESI
jgi:His-Xaa-Ser system protein HxsD